ncbi:MAG: TIGR00153 family protein [Wenzhouxiangella sp.]
MIPTSHISRIFGRSPLDPLQKHFTKVAKCARKLPKFIRASFAADWQQAEKQREKIVLLEHAADDLKRELRLNLPGSLFMPVSRADVLEMISLQDRIANRVKDISGLIIGRRLRMPEGIQEGYLTLLQRSIDAVEQARRSVQELDDLFQTGFRGAGAEHVIAMTDELSDIEDDSDAIQIALRAQLFGIEAELDPVTVMFIYKIIDQTGELGNIAQRVGSRLHLMIAR